MVYNQCDDLFFLVANWYKKGNLEEEILKNADKMDDAIANAGKIAFIYGICLTFMTIELFNITVKVCKCFDFLLKIVRKKETWSIITTIPLHYKFYYIMRLLPIIWYYFIIFSIHSTLKSMVDKEENFQIMAFEDTFKISYALNLVLVYIWLNFKIFKICKFKKVYFSCCIFWFVLFCVFLK